MSDDNNIKKYSSADIERYHKGLMSSKERHDLEKAALEDTFLAEALEGYAFAGTNLAGDLAAIRAKLDERTSERKVVPIAPRRNYSFMRVAAVIILLAGAGWLVYQFSTNNKNNKIAETAPKQEQHTGDTTVQNMAPPAGSTTTTTDQFKESHKDSHAVVTLNKPVNSIKTDSIVPPKRTTGIDKAPVIADTKIAPAAPVKSVEENREVLDGKVTDKAIAKEEVKTANAMRKKEAVGEKTDMDELAKNKPPASRGADDQFGNQKVNTFRGRVLDNTNSGVPFANVMNVQDNNAGTYTDANGYFALTSADSVLNVQIHSVGFANHNVQLRNDATNKVVLQEDRKGLSEIVINNSKPNTIARNTNGTMILDEPQPADGWEKYDSYLANNLVIPEDFKATQKASGAQSVQVSFDVNKFGEPINIKVEHSLCASCDKEAIRLVKEGPKWKRAGKKGRTVVTINF